MRLSIRVQTTLARRKRKRPFLYHFQNMLVLASMICAMLFSIEAVAESGPERIDKVKTAFVLNIARFVSWPSRIFEANSGQLLLCLYKEDPFKYATDGINGKLVSGHRVRIERVKKLAESSACNILLIGENRIEQFNHEISINGQIIHPVLTVADLTNLENPDILKAGVMVG